MKKKHEHSYCYDYQKQPNKQLCIFSTVKKIKQRRERKHIQITVWCIVVYVDDFNQCMIRNTIQDFYAQEERTCCQ
jgi:hypothetical protein